MGGGGGNERHGSPRSTLMTTAAAAAAARAIADTPPEERDGSVLDRHCAELRDEITARRLPPSPPPKRFTIEGRHLPSRECGSSRERAVRDDPARLLTRLSRSPHFLRDYARFDGGAGWSRGAGPAFVAPRGRSADDDLRRRRS